MTTGHVFIACSLDGFIARPDGDLDWLMRVDTGGDDHGYDAMMASADGLIMGRGTFEKVQTFEPWSYHKPVVVMSRSRQSSDIPEALEGQVEICDLSPLAVMEKVRRAGWKRAYIDGGQLIQSFLAAGLIEDMIITRAPVLIGQGLPLFGEVLADVQLEHLGTKGFASGLVQSHYQVVRDV
ncbi:MAG: dihydrofolate reductase family protein [Hyphomicrobiales bacterium]